MNLNQIRILEACHKFLIGLTEFEEKLQNDSLVYRFQDKNITFVTYQKYRNLSFIDFKLRHDYLDDSITYIDDREDLINAFPSQHELRALARVSDPEQARIQIFKLLSQANLETLTEKNPNAKKRLFWLPVP
jgi:hypothetical protein